MQDGTAQRSIRETPLRKSVDTVVEFHTRQTTTHPAPQLVGIVRNPIDPYGRSMTRLHIEHPITAYPTWREAFDRFADARVGAGVLSTRLARPIHDDHYMVIDLGFATPAAAQSFLAFLVQHVWATPASSPGLAGTPRTMILDELD